MPFMWRGVSSLTERLNSRLKVRYLLIVPFLVLFVVASYSVGRLSVDAPRETKIDGDESAIRRERRDAVSAPPTQTGSIVVESFKAPNLVLVHQSTVLKIQPPETRSYRRDQSKGGAVYTRWGRTECPVGSDMVYAGITGGSWYDSHGGGSNPLCLPMEPQWGVYNENVEKASKIYGAEYESPSGFNFRNVGGKAPHDHNIPCVVCHSLTRASVLMVPARNICYNDWYLEYTGYLMSAHPGHKGRSRFICVDGSPESDLAGYRDEGGSLFYNVEGACGSLPCPPYVQRREIVCAVCTK